MSKTRIEDAKSQNGICSMSPTLKVLLALQEKKLNIAFKS